MSKDVLTVDQLLALNEMMLGRGMPNKEDGIGYNKADYGACSNYYYGLSDAQIYDLAKRLVKYSETQLHLDKQMMKDTAEYYKSLVKDGADRNNGISINITENGTLISFRYNEDFIEVIRRQPKRRWDSDNKQWIVSNDRVIPTLNELSTVGADVSNALAYARNHPLIKDIAVVSKVDVFTKLDGDYALLKFCYNKNIIDEIKQIDHRDRQWNPYFKFWAVKQTYLDGLKESLKDVANFKTV